MVYSFSNITALLILLESLSTATTFGTVIVHLTSMHASLQSHKLGYDIIVFDLICLPVLHFPYKSSFISILSFVLNLDVEYFYCLTNLLFSYISLHLYVIQCKFISILLSFIR